MSEDQIKVIDGTYEIITQLGKGAQGVIYKIRNIYNNNILCLKMVNLPKQKDISEAMLREAMNAEFKIIKNLKHPNIIDVYDFGFDEVLNKYYFTMEYLDGAPISKFLNSECSVELFTDICYQCLLGLNYLHANKIIHFDIKPDNIFIQKTADGSHVVKLLDFGLSELSMQDANLKAKGTLLYMAPEIFIDHTKIGLQIDLYSLGITFLHSLFNQEELFSLSSIASSQEVVKSLNNAYLENMELVSKLKNRKIALFLSQLIEPNPDIRLASASESISALNRIFNTNYTSVQIGRAVNLVNNSKFLLREELVDSIVHQISSSSKGAVFFIESETGNGKTKVIQRINYILSLNLQRTIQIEAEHNHPDFRELALAICEKIGHHQHNRSDMKEEYAKIKEIKEGSENEITLLTDVVLNLLSMYANKYQPIIILEDIEKYKLNARKLMRKLIHESTKRGFIVLMSITMDRADDDVLDGYRLISEESYVHIFRLEPLNYEDIETIEHELLGEVNNKPKDFIQSILGFSQGSFKKTLQIYDYLIEKNIIQKLSDIYYFNKTIDYHNLISTDFGHYLNESLTALTEVELKVLTVLTISYFKITLAEIANILSINVYDLKYIMRNLEFKRIVKKKSRNQEEYYLLDSQEIKEYALSKIGKRELRSLFILFKNLTLSNSQAAQSLNDLCDMMLLNSFEEKFPFSQIFDDLLKYDNNNNYYFIICSFIRLSQNGEFRFRLELALLEYFFLNNREKCKEQLKRVNKLYSSIKSVANRTAYLLININYSHIHSIVKIDVAKILEKEFDFLVENVSFDSLFDSLMTLIFQLGHEAGNSKLIEWLYHKLDQYLQQQQNVNSLYYINLTQNAIRLNLVDYTHEQLDQLCDKIRAIQADERSTQLYFRVIEILNYTINRVVNFGEPAWSNYEDLFTRLIQDTLSYKNKALMLDAMQIVAFYYYNSLNYNKAFAYYTKILEFCHDNNLQASIKTYDDFSSLKYFLYYPVHEIEEIDETMKQQHKENDNLISYVIVNFNQVFLYFKKGDFTKARKTILTGLSYFKYASQDFCLEQFYLVAQFFPDIFEKREMEVEIKNMLKKGVITKEAFEYMNKQLDVVYLENLWQRFHCITYPEVIDGAFNESMPMVIMEYIKREKKLPQHTSFMQNIPSNFLNKHAYGDYLAYLISQFMLTKNEKILDKIHQTAKKLFINGYLIMSLYLLTPFIEFCLYLNVPFEQFSAIFYLYKDIREQFLSSLDQKQLPIFQKTRIFYLGKKIFDLAKKRGLGHE